MTIDLKVDRSVDCRGSYCPVPVIRARQAINTMSPGQVLEIIATDPGAKGDFPAFARNTGHELLSAVDEGGIFKFYFRVTG